MLSLARNFVRVGAWSVLVVLVAAGAAQAQLPAGHKITGGYKSFWSGKSASRSLSHARDHAVGAHEYLAQSAQPDPKVVEEQVSEVLRNLETAKKHFATIRKDYSGDKETLAAIDRIEKHLAGAMEHHGKLCECCQEKDFQAIMAMECCNDMTKEIEAALSEHESLMRQLASKAAAEAKRPKADAETKKPKAGVK